MKLGNFVVVVLCLSLFSARAGADGEPAELVRRAHAYQRAGNAEQALAYFCRYMYADAAGPLADEASANARAIAAKLGYPSDSDHAACSGRPRASQPTPVAAAVTTVVPARPPRITKREIVGLSVVGGSIVSFGLALAEANRLREIGEDIKPTTPRATVDALEDRRDSAALRQKLFLVSGGVTLVTGGILYVIGRNDRKRAERAYVAPSLMKNGGGLVLGGRF